MGRGESTTQDVSVTRRSNSRASLWDRPTIQEADPFHLTEVEGEDILREKVDTRQWKQLLNGFQDPQSGMSVIVPSEHCDADGLPNPVLRFNTLSYHCEIHKDGRAVGDLNFYFKPDERGDVELRVGGIELRFSPQHDQKAHADDSRTGTGFGTQVINLLEEQARRSGIKRMSLHATGLGSYVWAKIGYEPDPRQMKGDSFDAADQNELHAIANSMLGVMRGISETRPDLIPQVDVFQRKVEARQFTSIQQLAQFGRENQFAGTRGQKSWLGKEALIEGPNWHGVKPL